MDTFMYGVGQIFSVWYGDSNNTQVSLKNVKASYWKTEIKWLKIINFDHSWTNSHSEWKH